MKPCLEWRDSAGRYSTAIFESRTFADGLLVDWDGEQYVARIHGIDQGRYCTMEEAKLGAEAALQKMLTEALETLMEARRQRNREEERERVAATELTPEQVAALKVGDAVSIYVDRGHLCWTGVVKSRTPKRGRLRVCGPRGQSEQFDDRGVQVSNRDKWHTRYLGPAVPAKEG